LIRRQFWHISRKLDC